MPKVSSPEHPGTKPSWAAHPVCRLAGPYNREDSSFLSCVCRVRIGPEHLQASSLCNFSQIPGFPLPLTDREAFPTLGLSRLHESRACIRLE